MNLVYSNNNQKHINIVLYFFVFCFALFYVTVNPEAGRDYHTYIRLINEINEGTYFTEVGFYAVAKSLTFFWFTPEQIILTLRTVFFLLILRFFYFSSSKHKILGAIFFLFVPNVFIGSLNALQTWLAISIFMQVFIDNKGKGISDKKFLYCSLLAFAFHYFAFVYVMMYVSYRYFSNKVKLIALVAFILSVQILKPFIFDFFALFGYLKYLKGEEANIKFLVLSFVFIVVYLVSAYFSKNKKNKQIFYDLVFALILFVFMVFTFNISGKILLRTLNFFLPFVWLGIIIFLKKIGNVSFILSGGLAILLIFYFFMTIDFNSDMLNLKGFKNIL